MTGPPAETRPDERLTRERMEEIARILDEPQLKRLGGTILSLSLEYVYAVQQAPAAIRQLLSGAPLPAPPVGVDTRPWWQRVWGPEWNGNESSGGL